MLLYEMMAGHPPFQGEDEEDLFSSIVNTEVRWGAAAVEAADWGQLCVCAGIPGYGARRPRISAKGYVVSYCRIVFPYVKHIQTLGGARPRENKPCYLLLEK